MYQVTAMDRENSMKATITSNIYKFIENNKIFSDYRNRSISNKGK